jgi:hypothetical protein
MSPNRPEKNLSNIRKAEFSGSALGSLLVSG